MCKLFIPYQSPHIFYATLRNVAQVSAVDTKATWRSLYYFIYLFLVQFKLCHELVIGDCITSHVSSCLTAGSASFPSLHPHPYLGFYLHSLTRNNSRLTDMILGHLLSLVFMLYSS